MIPALPTLNHGSKTGLERTAYKVHGRSGREPPLCFHILPVHNRPFLGGQGTRSGVFSCYCKICTLVAPRTELPNKSGYTRAFSPYQTRIRYRISCPVPAIRTSEEVTIGLTTFIPSSAQPLNSHSNTSLHVFDPHYNPYLPLDLSEPLPLPLTPMDPRLSTLTLPPRSLVNCIDPTNHPLISYPSFPSLHIHPPLLLELYTSSFPSTPKTLTNL